MAAEIAATWRVAPMGDAGVVVRSSARSDAAALKAVAASLRATGAFVDVVAGSTEVAVFVEGDGARARVEAALVSLRVEVTAARGARHELDVVFDGEDLPRLATARGVSERHMIDAFVARDYAVRLLGFLPGFAYLGDVPELLKFPRLEAPRRRVAPQTLAVAGDLAGVYPLASPGGWNLLGRVTGARLFDPSRAEPALLGENDTVRFRAIQAVDAPAEVPRVEARADHGTDTVVSGLKIVRAPPGSSIQDLGRPGHRHRAVPVSGPLDARAALRANLAVGNDPDAPLVEIPPGTFAAAATAPCVISVDGEAPRELARDALLEIPESASFVRYLAVRGGFDVPRVLGSASTFLAGGFGGFAGRALARGDVVGVGARPPRSTEEPAPDDHAGDGPLVVLPASHDDRFGPGARDALCAGVFRVGAKSRAGTRLVGGAIPRDRSDDAPPEPMLPGAIQIATDGTPMILGPDAATTGGYPVLGVLDRASLARLGAARPGDEVRFVLAPGG